jgi:hypothetical protein
LQNKGRIKILAQAEAIGRSRRAVRALGVPPGDRRAGQSEILVALFSQRLAIIHSVFRSLAFSVCSCAYSKGRRKIPSCRQTELVQAMVCVSGFSNPSAVRFPSFWQFERGVVCLLILLAVP